MSAREQLERARVDQAMNDETVMDHWFARYFVHLYGEAVDSDDAGKMADRDIEAALHAWSGSVVRQRVARG